QLIGLSHHWQQFITIDYAMAGIAFQPNNEVFRRQKNQSLDKRKRLFTAPERWLLFKQRNQFLNFTPRQQTGVIEYLGRTTFWLGPLPVSCITGDDAGMRLNFDEVHTLGRDQQQIDFVDRAIGGSELEVSPSTIGVMIGQNGLSKSQCLAFPGKVGGSDLLPVLIHYFSSLSLNSNSSPTWQRNKRQSLSIDSRSIRVAVS